MTEKELKKLSRVELLQLLVAQSKKIDQLTQDLEKANRELGNRRIAIKEAGNIARASLAINNVFEVAQKAADQYLENIKMLSDSFNKESNSNEE